MAGFLDGINDSLVNDNPIETMDENTRVNLVFDKEKLYKNMVDAKAGGFTIFRCGMTFLIKRQSTDCIWNRKIRYGYRRQKVGRNDPCPCGSGKKYKFCCGKNK